MKLGNHIQKIINVDPDSFTVQLQFDDGARAQVNLRAIFARPKGLAAEILRGDMFSQCFIEAGALAWPNGFELCPDVLWEQAVPMNKKKRSTSCTAGTTHRKRRTNLRNTKSIKTKRKKLSPLTPARLSR